jgi:hypothetical protein
MHFRNVGVPIERPNFNTNCSRWAIACVLFLSLWWVSVELLIMNVFEVTLISMNHIFVVNRKGNAWIVLREVQHSLQKTQYSNKPRANTQRPEHDFPVSEKWHDGLVVLLLKNAATAGGMLHCFKSFHNTETEERVGISLYNFRRLMPMSTGVRKHEHWLPLCCCFASRHYHHSIMYGKVCSRLMSVFQYI